MQNLSLKQPNDMQDLIIKFGGATNQITANTLINSLIHFTNMIEQVNYHVDETKKVEVKINALPSGSFLVNLQVGIKEVLDSNILSKETIGYCGDLVKTIVEIYKLAKFLKNKKPKSITKNENYITVENNNGTVNNFDLRGATIYLDNKHIRENVSQSFETLESDSGVTEFEFLNKNKEPLLSVPKADFIDLSIREDEPINEITEKELIKENVIITPQSFDWSLKKQWQFYYEGNLIPVKLKDEEFKKIVNSGEEFAKGDSLRVDLGIIQEKDIATEVYINKSYRLIKFHEHIKRAKQSKFDFPPNSNEEKQ